MSMGDVRMQTGIIGVFRGEKKETQKRDRKHFPGLRKPWQNSGQEKLINLRFCGGGKYGWGVADGVDSGIGAIAKCEGILQK